MRTRPRPGHSFVELLFALALLAVLLGMAGPPLRRAIDGIAVRAARDALAAAHAAARVIAVGAGGASLVITPASATARIEDALGTPREPLRLGHDYGVRLSVDGAGTDTVVLRFDALGIGRLANRTIRLRRGRAEAGLTISSYGRARRW